MRAPTAAEGPSPADPAMGRPHPLRSQSCARRMAGTLRVGILGAGWAGESHAAAYSRLPGVEITGLWNRTKTRADALACKLGYADLTVYDDWQSADRYGELRRDQHRHCSHACSPPPPRYRMLFQLAVRARLLDS